MSSTKKQVHLDEQAIMAAEEDDKMHAHHNAAELHDMVADRKSRKMTLNTALEDIDEKVFTMDKQNLFELADMDNTGSLSFDNFSHLYDAMVTQVRKEIHEEISLKHERDHASRRKSLYKRMFVISMVVILLQLLLNSAVITTVVAMFKDSYVSVATASLQPVSSDGGGQVIATAEATVSAPLYVAPVLPKASLQAVKTISVTYADEELDEEVEQTIQVASVKRVNTTAVEFLSPIAGLSLRVWNGKAEMVSSTSEATTYFPVCVANISCSRFEVKTDESEAIKTRAVSELEKAGFSTDHINVTARRLLEGRRLPGGRCEKPRVLKKGNDDEVVVDNCPPPPPPSYTFAYLHDTGTCLEENLNSHMVSPATVAAGTCPTSICNSYSSWLPLNFPTGANAAYVGSKYVSHRLLKTDSSICSSVNVDTLEPCKLGVYSPYASDTLNGIPPGIISPGFNNHPGNLVHGDYCYIPTTIPSGLSSAQANSGVYHPFHFKRLYCREYAQGVYSGECAAYAPAWYSTYANYVASGNQWFQFASPTNWEEVEADEIGTTVCTGNSGAPKYVMQFKEICEPT